MIVGLEGMYRGLGPVLVSLGISNFVYFYSNNLLKVVLTRLTKEKVTVLQNLLIASIAGVVNVLLTCPLWVANTRLKLQNKADTKPKYQGLFHAMQLIGKEEGIGALWNGVRASLVLVSNPTIHFVVYDKVNSIMTQAAENAGRKHLNALEVFVAGAIAKAVATLVTYPIQLAQSRMRAKKAEDGAANEWQILLKMYKEEGVASWFSGLNIKMLQTVLTAAFQFMCYEKIAALIFALLKKKSVTQ
eukprot:TRINITY_DN1404_c0_g1_i2.p1 TRINITY_DN1404_c0_g1~~TRINITY_DN1404_c0_g1_i2.p1  ORF type:complete len:245 (+),score=35.43 TRINITY_DN1404_c0_g1_i2:224-958(+)